ncbi:MAG TPA: ABC transporter substrate-binding protein, partial [Jiangellaceae bacterium]|nr:ABC transporter substrate-binding protein [Jiangellaceae bacterium]
MRVLARKGAVIGAAGFALVLSACGGGDGDGGGDGGGAGAEGPTGAVIIGGCQPQNLLIPANTNEVCGGDPQDVIFSGLSRYNPDTAAPDPEIAESIESDDNITWTVTLKDGWTFHDGTPVTSESFVNAWNWSALGENAYLSSYFFEPIEGFADVQGELDAEGAYVPGSATAEEMSGLTVVDDKTFTIKLVSPQSSFPQRLGYLAFSPLPEVFYDDPEAFGHKPIGSGPFQVVEYNENADIKLTAYDDYAGETKPKVKDVTFAIYADDTAEYNDLQADNVDVVTQLPPTALAGEQYKTDLGDRYIEKETGGFSSITFPPERVDPTLANINLRRALSLAIDRDLITQNIFQGSRTPATGWVSPVVEGYKPDQCGEWCTYDPERAKELLAEAGGYEGTLTLSYNADGPNAEWCEAACNSIRNALGVDCVATPVVDFATFRTQITNREMKGLFRTGWQMDYPSIENFLSFLYATGSSSNDGDYSNPDFDAKLAEAAAAPTTEEAITLY